MRLKHPMHIVIHEDRAVSIKCGFDVLDLVRLARRQRRIVLMHAYFDRSICITDFQASRKSGVGIGVDDRLNFCFRVNILIENISHQSSPLSKKDLSLRDALAGICTWPKSFSFSNSYVYRPSSKVWSSSNST